MSSELNSDKSKLSECMCTVTNSQDMFYEFKDLKTIKKKTKIN